MIDGPAQIVGGSGSQSPSAVPGNRVQMGTPPAKSGGKMDPVREAKLRKAAAEFESILLSTFWKSMKESIGGQDEDSSDPAHDSLEDWAMQAMSTAVGKAGGLGIGKLILKHLEKGEEAGEGEAAGKGIKPYGKSADKTQ